MDGSKITDATALAASLRQIADAQYTRRQRFNGRLPADVQEVLRMAADYLADRHPADEAQPLVYGIRVKGNSAIVGALPIKLKDFPATNAEWVKRYEEIPLYASPAPQPAQVDLEQFRDAVLDQYAHTLDRYGMHEELVEAKQERDRLLALIDSHAK